MNKASQQALVQETNMNLISIRQAELNYFNTFFSNFGTQCALLIGFICGSISQVPGVGADIPLFWVWLYWITSAVCLAAAVHVLVCTVFVNVFGQGLALRGPVGSMIRAVNGMVLEQEQIIIAFIAAMIFFGLQMVELLCFVFNS
jgi:hypothetical protein